MKIGALALCALATVAQAQYLHPMPQNALTIATYDATRKCAALDSEQSIEYCLSMPGKTLDHVAARRAASLALKQRGAFIETCDEAYGIMNCRAIADAMMDEGIQRALIAK